MSESTLLLQWSAPLERNRGAPPDPGGPTPVAAFCAELRQRWRDCGRDLPGIAREIGVSRAHLYSIVGGQVTRPPDWARMVRPMLLCCGVTDAELTGWRSRHETLIGVHEDLRRRRRDNVSPAPVPAQLPPGPERPTEPVTRDRGVELRVHRLRRGLSQEELAARTGLSVRTIRYLESGRSGRPRPETMRLLAEAFGLGGEPSTVPDPGTSRRRG